MADFERRQLEFGLEFVRWSSDEQNNFSEGSSKPKKDVQVIRVQGAAAPQVFELELFVSQLVCIAMLSSNLAGLVSTRSNAAIEVIKEVITMYRLGLAFNP